MSDQKHMANPWYVTLQNWGKIPNLFICTNFEQVQCVCVYMCPHIYTCVCLISSHTEWCCHQLTLGYAAIQTTSRSRWLTYSQTLFVSFPISCGWAGSLFRGSGLLHVFLLSGSRLKACPPTGPCHPGSRHSSQICSDTHTAVSRASAWSEPWGWRTLLPWETLKATWKWTGRCHLPLER